MCALRRESRARLYLFGGLQKKRRRKARNPGRSSGMVSARGGISRPCPIGEKVNFRGPRFDSAETRDRIYFPLTESRVNFVDVNKVAGQLVPVKDCFPLGSYDEQDLPRTRRKFNKIFSEIFGIPGGTQRRASYIPTPVPQIYRRMTNDSGTNDIPRNIAP